MLVQLINCLFFSYKNLLNYRMIIINDRDYASFYIDKGNTTIKYLEKVDMVFSNKHSGLNIICFFKRGAYKPLFGSECLNTAINN